VRWWGAGAPTKEEAASEERSCGRSEIAPACRCRQNGGNTTVHIISQVVRQHGKVCAAALCGGGGLLNSSLQTTLLLDVVAADAKVSCGSTGCGGLGRCVVCVLRHAQVQVPLGRHGCGVSDPVLAA
jgi:hypothetical protein